MAHIVIQLGHCYRRSGATGTSGVDGDPTEQGFATAAGHRSVDLLLAAGHTAGIILADDPAHLYAGDAFVAIHCDGSISDQARGASVGYRTQQGADLAAAWKRQYAAAGWSGFRPDNYTPALNGYYGTRTAVAQGNRSAFIAEAGFLTSPVDEALLTPPDGADRFARALTNAVAELFGGIPAQEEDDLPYSVEQLMNIFRAVLDEGTAAGQQGWANTSKATLAGIQGVHNLVAAGQLDPAALADLIIARLPAGGDMDQATVEAGVRAVFEDLSD